MPRRTLVLAALVVALAVVAAACGGSGGEPSVSSGAPTANGEVPTGGTLHLALQSDMQEAFDPQKEYYGVAWAFFRCCLLRTLLSYNGKTTGEGGAEVQPDLAAEMPESSADGLTWTFTLKPGIHYSPPLQDVEVTAQDFIRAMEREACSQCATGGYNFYYAAIEGFSEYASGEADTITGLEAPDEHTLVVTTTEPTGDLPYRMAMPAAAPIPPNPNDRDARLGIAEGHDDNFGRFQVGTGPYMFEGTDRLDFSVDPSDREPVSGYEVGQSFVLVRNPSYDPDSDDLREGYVDRIEVAIGGETNDLALKVDAGELDMVYDGVPPPQQVQRYSTDPELKDQIHPDPSDAVRYVEMNLALPPFDDIHVRKAMNLILDKEGFRQLRGGPLFGELAGHIMVQQLPLSLIKFAVVSHWEGEGSFLSEVRILTPDRQQPIVVSQPTRFEIAPGGFADNISFFMSVTFPTSGQYVVQTLVDSTLFNEQLLTVTNVSESELLGASEAVN